MTFKSKTIKILGYVALLVALVIIVISYYNSSSVQSKINRTRDHIGSLVDLSQKKDKAAAQDPIAILDKELTTNPHSTPAMKQFFRDEFLGKWSKGKLSPEEVESFRQKNEELSKEAKSTASGMIGNQVWTIVINLILWGLLFGLALFTNVLRDVVDDPLLKQQVQNGDCFPPFSLSRTQLGLWITLIASFYVHAVLWKHCPLGDIELNTTSLILMGISAGTFATGAVIDTVEIQQKIPRNQNQLTSGNFLKDLLSDSQGVSIHRFQNVVWTIVAVITYFYAYNNNITEGCLPDLDSTVLALTGISSATYLMLKTRENIFNEVKIHLSLDAAEKAEISKNGWVEKKVVLKDASDKDVTVSPDFSSPFDFILRGLSPGRYTITAVMKAKIEDKETELTGTFDGLITSSTVQPIEISIAKK